MQTSSVKLLFLAAGIGVATVSSAAQLTVRAEAGQQQNIPSQPESTDKAAGLFRVTNELSLLHIAEVPASPEAKKTGQLPARPRRSFDLRQNPFKKLDLGSLLRGAFAMLAATNDTENHFPNFDPLARLVPTDQELFQPDPIFNLPYNAEEQIYIYGGKHPNTTARPLIELGRELYQYGPLQPGVNLFGRKNLVFPQLLVFGDWRNVIAYVDNGVIEKGILATKLNLDVDFQITGTERIHAFFTPLDRDGMVTRAEFAGRDQESEFVLNPEPGALFFEGDFGRILAGFTDRDNRIDLPFTFGLIPLLTQNGIWLQDAFNGFAFTIPARNSPTLDISNMDLTFFAGFDKVTTGAIGNDHSASIFGIAGFFEANQGYWEFGYGYTLGRKKFDDLSYHNLSLAFTRRYFEAISNSVRVVYNFGQDPDRGRATTADGVLILIENSLITSQPLSLVPYFNVFAGFNKPQSIARAGGAGGILVNTGLIFETDGITGFPKLDDTGHNTYGGALGIEYLFALDQQLVLEVGGLNAFGNPDDRTAMGYQLGFGARYQRPLNNAWIVRADVIAATREHQRDLFGVRVELRRKF
jgi:hypothetical protein